jgi:hypothetical protein
VGVVVKADEALAAIPLAINSGTAELIGLPSRGDCRISNIEQ